MGSPTILLVEDNPVTRKLLQFYLREAGFSVLEAPDGNTALALAAAHAPGLVVQDLLLPDMDGFKLVARLRALPALAEVPILAVSGFLSKIEQARDLRPGFTDFLAKPVDPPHLLETVRAYLGAYSTANGKPGKGRRILVADDNPLQLKLFKLQAEQLGFRVKAVHNGEEALWEARRAPPDAIVSDVLMPGLDGFHLCLSVRQDARLADVPVLLTSAVYRDEADRQLASVVGASAFVLRTPDNRELTEALLAALEGKLKPLPKAVELPVEGYTQRVIRQLEYQVSFSTQLARRLALLEAKLGILGRILETLEVHSAGETVLGELLYRCLDAAGIPQGAAYLLEADGRLSLRSHVGYSKAALGPLADFFGRQELLYQALKRGEPAEVRFSLTPAGTTESEPDTPVEQSVLLAPLVHGRKPLGVVAMVAPPRGFDEDWVAFARVASNQISQAMELANTVSRLQASEQRYRDLVQGLDAVVWEAEGPDRRFTFVSQRAENLFGFPVHRWLTEPDFWARLIHPEDRAPTVARFRQAVARGRDVFLSYRAQAADGRTVWLHDTVRVTRGAAGSAPVVRGVMVDVTAQQEAEESLRRSTSLLQAVISGTTDAIFVKDREGRYLMINRAGAHSMGKSVEEVIGRDDRVLFDAESAERVIGGDRRVMESGQVQTYEETTTAGGVTRVWLSTKGPYRDLQGSVQGIIGISRDVTERKRMEEQEVKMRMAREIQRRFFPAAPPRVPGLDVSGASHPAELTGGDLFDFITLPDGLLALAVADASGHGFPAALLMAETRAYLRALAATRTDLAEVMTLLNRALAAEHQGEACFVTLALLVVDPGRRTFRYASAGHPPGYHLDAAGRVRTVLHSTAPPLGIDAATVFSPSEEIALAEGDVVVLLTDGMIEAAPRGGAAIGANRVLEVVRANRAEAAGTIVARALEAVRAHCRNQAPLDDQTTVVVKVGAAAGA
jgi:PAS domain S-box-containing protein